jgi:hypothetical protein
MEIAPRIGEEIGDVMEADIPGCYHLITGKQPSKVPGAQVTVFAFLPTWRMVDGQLVPMTEQEGQDAYTNRRT